MKTGVEVRPSIVPGAVVVAPVGEADLMMVPELREQLLKSFNGASDYSVVLCDLSRTDFIDSSGLGCLLAADKFAKAHGRECWIVGARGRPKRILAITCLIDVLTCYDSLEAAEDALATRQQPA